MLLAIDIGNSTTKFGIFDNEILVKKFTIPTDRKNSANEIFDLIKFELNQDITDVVVSSVVTEAENSFRELAANKLNAKIGFVDNTFDSGLEIKYFPPETLGIDRLIAAFAAVEKYGAPIVICDFGTATTIDAVNAKNEFLGGVIAPGMRTLADSLFQKTSKLPRVEIVKTRNIFGNSTISSIQSGIYFGYIGLVDGILQKMIDELGGQPQIAATGGFSGLIGEDSKFIEIIDNNLMLDGLRLIYKKMKN